MLLWLRTLIVQKEMHRPTFYSACRTSASKLTAVKFSGMLLLLLPLFSFGLLRYLHVLSVQKDLPQGRIRASASLKPCELILTVCDISYADATVLQQMWYACKLPLHGKIFSLDAGTKAVMHLLWGEGATHHP